MAIRRAPRIIHDNLADTAAMVLTAGVQAGALGVDALKTDDKTQALRVLGSSMSLRLTWAAPVVVSAVAVPLSNVSAEATIRARLYSAVGGALQVDSAAQTMAPGPRLGAWRWNGPLNANAFAFGGGVKSCLWLGDDYVGRCLDIDIVDPEPQADWLDVARLVVGSYWSPRWGARWGAESGVSRLGKTRRTDAGGLVVEAGPVHDVARMDLSEMPEADRSRFAGLLAGNGVARFVFLSRNPEDDQPTLEQDGMIYGAINETPVKLDRYDSASAPCVIQGW